MRFRNSCCRSMARLMLPRRVIKTIVWRASIMDGWMDSVRMMGVTAPALPNPPQEKISK